MSALPWFFSDPRRACNGMSTNDFYPDGQRGASKQKLIAEAKATCRRCPFRRACAAYALDTGEPWGIWGGLTETKRRAILRRREQRASGLAVAA